MTKRATLLFVLTLLAGSISGQTFDRSDFMVNEPDTVMKVPMGSMASYCSPLEEPYGLKLYADQAIYELSVYSSSEELSFIYSLSWGNYEIKGEKIFFHDRIAGFKMTASRSSDGFKFCKDYFPGINKNIWKIGAAEASDGIYAFFDRDKALRYRESYNKKYPKPFKFTPGLYLRPLNLEVAANGKWNQKLDDFLLAEGEWYREDNILVLKCPKLECNFYMTIGKNKLGSMLFLGGGYGFYYLNQEEHDRLFYPNKGSNE